MKLGIILVLLLSVLVCDVGAFDKTDLLLEATWQILHVVDWGQTLDIARNPHSYYELNPILGKHPSVGKVNLYMLASAITHFAISYYLPQPYKRYWQYVTIGVTGSLVIHNFNIGLKVRF